MSFIRWRQVAEMLPENRQAVIVSRDNLKGWCRNFTAVFLVSDEDGSLAWAELDIDEQRSANLTIHAVQATDFWLPVPQEPPGFGVYDGGWPP